MNDDAQLFGDAPSDAEMFGDQKKGPRNYAPPREHSDEELGLTSGLIPYGFTTPDKSEFERKEAGPYGGDIAFLKEVAPFLAGGALGKGASMLLGRTAMAGGAMAARPAQQAFGFAREEAAPATSKAAEVLQRWLANNFAHGRYTGLALEEAKALAPGAVAAAKSAMGTGARTATAGGAATTPGFGAMVGGGMATTQQETPEQQAARVLLGRLAPNWVER